MPSRQRTISRGSLRRSRRKLSLPTSANPVRLKKLSFDFFRAPNFFFLCFFCLVLFASAAFLEEVPPFADVSDYVAVFCVACGKARRILP